MLLCSNELYVAPMPSSKFVWDPQHWRFRAEEARTAADQMTHEEARTIMRRIAMDYDRLAKLADRKRLNEKLRTDTPCAYCGSPRLPNNQSRCRVMFPDKARLRRLLPRLQTKSKLSLPSL